MKTATRIIDDVNRVQRTHDVLLDIMSSLQNYFSIDLIHELIKLWSTPSDIDATIALGDVMFPPQPELVTHLQTFLTLFGEYHENIVTDVDDDFNSTLLNPEDVEDTVKDMKKLVTTILQKIDAYDNEATVALNSDN